MPLEFTKTQAVASGLVGVEDAETLLEWLGKNPRGQVDLSDCRHLHAANLQVLIAARARIHAWPLDEHLAAWLQAALDRQDYRQD